MLSGKKVSEMFGKKNESTGFRILKRLESLGHINIERETIKTSSESAYFNAEHKFDCHRPNFHNSEKFEKVKRRTRVKNRSFLYRTIVKFPNVVSVNIF
jgi:hypothetical protein